MPAAFGSVAEGNFLGVHANQTVHGCFPGWGCLSLSQQGVTGVRAVWRTSYRIQVFIGPYSQCLGHACFLWNARGGPSALLGPWTAAPSQVAPALGPAWHRVPRQHTCLLGCPPCPGKTPEWLPHKHSFCPLEPSLGFVLSFGTELRLVAFQPRRADLRPLSGVLCQVCVESFPDHLSVASWATLPVFRFMEGNINAPCRKFTRP